MRLTNGYRVVISCLLAVCLCGLSFGLRGQRDAAAAADQQARQLRYDGVSREAFPALIGPWLRAGKYNPFTRIAVPAFPIPELGAGYVPQGMCYSQALGCIIISYYYPGGERPSLLALVDAESRKHVKSVYLLKNGGLPYEGHAGGVAAWENHVWVTSESRAWRLEAGDLKQAKNGASVRFRDSFKPASRGGIAFAAEGMLWVGDNYAEGVSPSLPKDHWDEESGNKAWCAGYRLSKRAPMGVEGLKHDRDSVAPAAVLSIQDSAQGACLASTGELLISAAFTSQGPAHLWVYPTLRGILEQPPARHVTIEKKRCPLWVAAPSMATAKQMLAPMSEGICELDGRIYTVYESAALLYRERAELYADHVYVLEERDFIP